MRPGDPTGKLTKNVKYKSWQHLLLAIKYNLRWSIGLWSCTAPVTGPVTGPVTDGSCHWSCHSTGRSTKKGKRRQDKKGRSSRRKEQRAHSPPLSCFYPFHAKKLLRCWRTATEPATLHGGPISEEPAVSGIGLQHPDARRLAPVSPPPTGRQANDILTLLGFIPPYPHGFCNPFEIRARTPVCGKGVEQGRMHRGVVQDSRPLALGSHVP